MATTHATQAGETAVQWGGNIVRRAIFTDISPEIVLEAMVRTNIRAQAAGTSSSTQLLPSNFRKRLAGVTEV